MISINFRILSDFIYVSNIFLPSQNIQFYQRFLLIFFNRYFDFFWLQVTACVCDLLTECEA